MPIPWNTDNPADEHRIGRNARMVLADAVHSARARESPSISLPQEWHRGFYAGCQLPVAYYVGEFRDADENFPELVGYEVTAGGFPGSMSADVPMELKRFETAIKRAVSKLDAEIPPTSVPESPGVLGSVLTLAAWAHGEWVRIHPFANGNGRTARLWANWCLVRYGLAPVVRLKPRPEGTPYGLAAQASMMGNHRPMVAVINSMIQATIKANR